MRRGASSSTRRTALRREAGPRRIDDHDVGRRQPALEQRAHGLGDVAGDEDRVLDPVGLRVLDRPLARLLDDLDADHAPRPARQRERDRADAGVEVPDDLLAGQAGLLDGELVEALAHRGVGLQERAGRDAQPQPEQLLGEPVAAGESVVGRPVVTSARRSDSACSSPTHSGTVSASSSTSWWRRRQLARRGDQDEQELARALGAADDEVAQVALVRALVERQRGRTRRPTPRPCGARG